jgi:hypothetical protein
MKIVCTPIPQNSYMVAMRRQKKTTPPVRSSPRRKERVIHFLTEDELQRWLQVMRSKRDWPIFGRADRHGLRAAEVGLL